MSCRLAVSYLGALALTLLAVPAVAQDAPLTTLMREQRLSGSSPLGGPGSLSRPDRLFADPALSSPDTLSGERPARRRDDAGGEPGKPGDAAVACSQPTATRARPTPGAGSGGSGPGEYGRFVTGGRTPETKPSEAAPRKPVDRPLYGGTERPLWRDPTASAEAQAAPRAPQAGDERGAASPTPGVDRPLWADASTPRPAADPCDSDAGTRHAGASEPPTQTLFFGTGPAR